MVCRQVTLNNTWDANVGKEAGQWTAACARLEIEIEIPTPMRT